MARRRYSDDFKATAVAASTASGVAQVASELETSDENVRKWSSGIGFTNSSLVDEKKDTLRDLFEKEIRAILGVMPDKRGNAPYNQLGTVLGILFDKIRLLDGLPTEIVAELPPLIVLMQQQGLNPQEVFQSMRAKLSNQPIKEIAPNVDDTPPIEITPPRTSFASEGARLVAKLNRPVADESTSDDTHE